MAANSASNSVSNRDAALAMLAGFLGWTLDAFDYFLVVIALPEIAKDFGVKNIDVTWSITLTLMFRPVGAFIFGLLADRFGRRGPMMIDLIFYSAVEVATGFAHTFTTFLILRALFGIGMGGEWGVGASLVMEKVSPRWRGVLSGLLQEGYAFGFLLAAVAARFILVGHSWRWLFYLGGIPALLALLIRLGVRESEVWEKNKSESWSQLGSNLGKHWKIWLYMSVLMAGLNFSSHGTQDYYRTFLSSEYHFSVATSTNVVIISMIGAIVGGMVFGLASDRIGRRLSMCIAFAGAIAAVPLWAFSHSYSSIALGAFCMQFMVQGAWGIIPAHLSELSPNSVRGFLPGFSYQCGNLIAASIATIQAGLTGKFGFPRGMGFSVIVIFIFAILVTVAGPERRGVQFAKDG